MAINGSRANGSGYLGENWVWKLKLELFELFIMGTGQLGRDGRPSQAGQPVRGKPTICQSLVTYGPTAIIIINVIIIFTFVTYGTPAIIINVNLVSAYQVPSPWKKDLRRSVLVLNIMAEFFLELWAGAKWQTSWNITTIQRWWCHHQEEHTYVEEGKVWSGPIWADDDPARARPDGILGGGAFFAFKSTRKSEATQQQQS